MKKFFSFVCAVLLVFSASAAPVAQKAQLVKKAPVAVEQMQKVQFEKAQSVKTISLENAQLSNQLSAAPALTVSNQKAAMQPKQMVAKHLDKAQRAQLHQQATNVARTPKRVAQSEELTITESEVDDSYVASDGEWDIYLLTTINGTDVIVNLYGYNETLEGTYDLATNMNEYSCVVDAAFTWSFYEEFTACSYTVTSLGNDQYSCEGSFSIESGDFTFSTTLSYAPHVPQVYTLTASAFSDDYYYGRMTQFTTEIGYFNFFINVDELESGKKYVWDDMDQSPDYSCYSEDGYYVTAGYTDADLTKTVEEDGSFTVVAHASLTNGDQVTINYAYEKPDAKEITLVADTLNFFTKMLSAGYYQMQGYTVDSTYAFSFYFISKSLSGFFTEEDMDAYSTWVDQKDGKKTVVSYQNLSAANIKASLVNDTLYYAGTMTLATNDGQEAIFTLNLSCPFKQEWGEWADFAPFGLNTGKYTFATFGAYTQTGIEVLERKDNTGLKQYKLKNWSKGYFDGVGQDLILNMNPDHTFTFASNPINLGADVYFADVATAYNNPAYASFNSYDPETGVFSFYTAVVLASSGSVYTAAEESLVMDKPITERDTIDIVSTALKYNDLIASNKVVIYYAADVPDYYLFRVTSNNATAVDGTFKWSDGTINDPNSYFSVSGTDKNYFQDGEFTVVTNNKDIALTGWMIGVDEKYYRLDMSYTAPTERDTVRFSGQGVTISECVNSQTGVQTGWFYELTDASTGYRFMLQSTVVANKYGTFSYEDKTLGSNYYNVFDPQGNRQQFVEGSITVGEVGDSLILDGELIAEDEKVYVLHFAQSAKVLNYDTDAPFDATFAWSDMSTDLDNGVIGIYATNAEGRTIGLELYADPAATEIPEGVYTISDTQEAGTALQSLGVAGGYLTKCYAGTLAASGGIDDCWFMVEGTITLSYDEYGKLKVVVDGKNSYDQPVTALVQYVKLEPKSTVDIVSTNLSYTDEWYAQYGIQEFVLTNDNYGVLLDIFADTLVGEFTEDDVDLADSYIVDFNTGVKIPVVNTGDIVVTLDGKNLALTTTLIGADTIQYNISATGYLGYIQGDAIDAYEGEFAVKNVTFAQYSKSQIALSASNEVGDTVTIVVKGELKNAVLPAGEYSRVMASTGFTAEYDVYPSFVGNNAGVWFIQSGKLTVAEDGSMLFKGLNSYDKDVTIKFIASHPTDLININAAVKATKVVRNGRMMVIKDAKVYSVLGQQIQ